MKLLSKNLKKPKKIKPIKKSLTPVKCFVVVDKTTGKWDRFSVYFYPSEYKQVRIDDHEEIRKVLITEIK